MPAKKERKVKEMASEYRFDYTKAKPNRFAGKMKPNVAWTVEKFVEEEKVVKAKPSAKKTAPKTGKNRE